MAILKEISSVARVKMPIGETWTVSRCRYSSEDGATARVCLATGIHGDERMGQLVIYDVAQRIMAQPQYLHGIIDMYPMLNALGLDCGERLVPSSMQLDMNRAFPGMPDGSALETICYAVMQDMKGADLVLDIHTSSQITSELYDVRIHEQHADAMFDTAVSLCPEVIWVLPDRPAHNASLSGALTKEGTHACIIMVDERRLRSQMIVDQVVEGIFCMLRSKGIWMGEAQSAPAKESIACMRTDKDICRVTCAHPGMYVPNEVIGGMVKEGDVLGKIFSALEGEPLETVVAPEAGLVVTQRRYSAVYPGTLIARLCRKERA